jgi:hypothetical protein
MLAETDHRRQVEAAIVLFQAAVRRSFPDLSHIAAARPGAVLADLLLILAASSRCSVKRPHAWLVALTVGARGCRPRYRCCSAPSGKQFFRSCFGTSGGDRPDWRRRGTQTALLVTGPSLGDRTVVGLFGQWIESRFGAESRAAAAVTDSRARPTIIIGFGQGLVAAMPETHHQPHFAVDSDPDEVVLTCALPAVAIYGDARRPNHRRPTRIRQGVDDAADSLDTLRAAHRERHPDLVRRRLRP